MTSTNKTNRWLAAVASSIFLVACGDGPSPDEVRERTTRLLKPMLTDSAEALDKLTQHKALEALLGGRSIQSLFDGEDDVAVGSSVPAPPRNEAEPVPSRVADDEEIDFDEAIAKLDEYLAEHIFNEANVESSSGGTTTFRIRGASVCDAAPSTTTVSGGAREPMPVPAPEGDWSEAQSALRAPEDDGAPDREADPGEGGGSSSCVEQIDRLELRIDATLAGDGIDLGLRVGSADGAVAVIELRPGRITVKAFLPAVAQAARDASVAVKEPLPEGFPSTLKGTLALTLTKESDGKVAVTLAVVDKIEVAGKVKGDDYRAELPTTDALARLAYDPKQDEIEAALGWPAMELLLPGNAIWRDELLRSFDKPLKLLLGGLTAKVRATADGKIAVEQIALGAESLPRLLLGDALLAEIELNPDQGGKAKLSVAAKDDLPLFTADPGLDLRAELRFDRLDGYLRDKAPAWAANERYQLTLAKAGDGLPSVIPVMRGESVSCAPQPMPRPGQEPPPVPADPCAPAEAESFVEVVSGTLTLQSFVNPQKIVVEAGQCLVSSDAASGDGPLDDLAAGACL